MKRSKKKQEHPNSETAQRLLEAFGLFRKLHGHHTPVEGLRPSEFWVLATLKQALENGEPGVRISDLGRKMDIATPTATQMVKRLETRGFVNRERSDSDRRTIHITLTKTGRSTMAAQREKLFETFNKLVAYLGEENSETLANLITEVYDFFSKQHKPESE